MRNGTTQLKIILKSRSLLIFISVQSSFCCRVAFIGHIFLKIVDNTGWQNFIDLMYQKANKHIPNHFWVLNPKKIFIFKSLFDFAQFAGFSAESAIFCGFCNKNIRKRDRVILVFLTERILSYDHLAKEKTQKSWKLDFWRNFKVWNFEFLVNFSVILI